MKAGPLLANQKGEEPWIIIWNEDNSLLLTKVEDLYLSTRTQERTLYCQPKWGEGAHVLSTTRGETTELSAETSGAARELWARRELRRLT
jgi:hypothetical protein